MQLLLKLFLLSFLTYPILHTQRDLACSNSCKGVCLSPPQFKIGVEADGNHFSLGIEVV